MINNDVMDQCILKDGPALIDEAMSLVTAVKVAFQNKREKYDEFLKLLVDYNAKRIDIRVVKEGVMELFKEHQDLLLGLNTFLPAGHEISLPLDSDEQQGDRLTFKDEQKDDEQ
jgi:histone deacetylase complex regulatory component SIN3